LFNRGDGQDVINDYDYGKGSGSYGDRNTSWGKSDKIKFGEGITADDLKFSKSGSDLVVQLFDSSGDLSGDQIIIENWYHFSSSYSTSHRIESFEFFDGRELLEAQITLAGIGLGTHGDDLMTGISDGNYIYHGLGGDDQIRTYSAQDTIYAGEGDDNVISSSGDDVVYGEQGNDVIDLGSGNDLVYGGQGDDLIKSGHGNDLVHGGLGDDRLNAGDGNDVAEGGEGDDLIEGSHSGHKHFDGGAGDDTLKIARHTSNNTGRTASYAVNTFEGGEGNDRIEGWTGADTYLFNRGDGQDVINDYDYGKGSGSYGSSNASWGKSDKIKFGEGVAVTDLVLKKTGNHLLVQLLGSDGDISGDQITIENWYYPSSAVSKQYRIEQFEFSDGSILAESAITAAGLSEGIDGGAGNDVMSAIWSGNYTYRGLAGDDRITTSSGHDTIYGGDGADTILSGSGDDVVYGGQGNDVIDSSNGNDVLGGGQGNDTLKTGYGNDMAEGGEGDDLIEGSHSGHKNFDGGAGDDTLKISRNLSNFSGKEASYSTNIFKGGQGHDRIEGWTGADTYLFNRGDGQDVINDYDYGKGSGSYGDRNTSWGKSDKIKFGEGIEETELWFRRDGNDLRVNVLGTNDQIQIENWFVGTNYKIEQLELSSGDSISAVGVEQLVNAMAAFESSQGEGISLQSTQGETIANVISANWQA
jgi:Ca2+-binding RTX toxin-like protein